MIKKDYKYLRFVPFSEIVHWDVKRYFKKKISSKYSIVDLKNQIDEEKQKFDISNKNCEYGILGVNNQTGIFDAYTENGSKIKQKYKRMETGWIAYNPYRVNVGSIGLKREYHHNEYISPAYVVFSCKTDLFPEYLFLLMKTSRFNLIIRDNTTGSVRQNLSYEILKNLQIPLPSLPEQNQLVAAYNAKIAQAEQLDKQASDMEKGIEDYLMQELGINTETNQNIDSQSKYHFLKFVSFKDIEEWGVDKILSSYSNMTFNYPPIRVNNLLKSAFRGKSPHYADNANVVILNQKCNRWNEIDLQYAKTVNEDWLNKIDNNNFTREGDVIINSTGEGTIGRASVITKDYVDFMYDSHILLIRFIDNVNSAFFVSLFNSSFGQSQVDSVKSAQATKQTELGIDNLSKIKIPLPPLEIQNEIVTHISMQKEQIKTLKQQAEQLRKEALEEFENEIFE